MFDPAQWAGAGSVVALMALAISFVLTSSKGTRARLQDEEREKRALQDQNRALQSQVDRAVLIMRQSGVPIPPDFWDAQAKGRTKETDH